jgi:hypothetical protein
MCKALPSTPITVKKKKQTNKKNPGSMNPCPFSYCLALADLLD